MVQITFKDMTKLFYFMTFIPKWPKKWIFLHFLHVLAPGGQNMKLRKKMNKMKKFRLVHTFFKCGLRFLIFGQEVPQKLKKMTQKRHKSRVHVFTRCACTRVRAGSQTILNSLGDQTLHMLKVW